MSIPAQLIYDVKLGVKDRCPIETCLSSGGQIMSRDAVLDAVRKLNEK
jgi:2-oxoglutarate ferredoxin oxidoreductase subunit alpha